MVRLSRYFLHKEEYRSAQVTPGVHRCTFLKLPNNIQRRFLLMSLVRKESSSSTSSKARNLQFILILMVPNGMVSGSLRFVVSMCRGEQDSSLHKHLHNPQLRHLQQLHSLLLSRLLAMVYLLSRHHSLRMAVVVLMIRTFHFKQTGLWIKLYRPFFYL